LRLCGEILLLTKRKAFWSQPPVAQQRLLNFTGGPLLASCDKLDTCVILTNFCNFGKISSR